VPRVQTGLSQPVLTDLLNSSASMANFIWFIDNKLLKFYHFSHKKMPKTITFTHLLDFVSGTLYRKT